MKIQITLSSLALLFMTLPATAATYYLDAVNGDDLKSGATTQPWKTFAKAQRSVKAGDTVILRTGDYGNVEFDKTSRYGESWRSPVIFKVDPSDRYVDARINRMYIHDSGDKFLIFEGLHFKPYPGKDFARLDYFGTLRLRHGVRHIKFFKLKINNEDADLGRFTAIHISCDLSNCVGAEDIAIEGSEITGVSIGIELGGNAKHVLIKGNHLHDLSGSAIRVHSGSDRIIENNIISHQRPEWLPKVHGSGLSIRGGDIIIRRNILYNYGNTRPIRFYQGIAAGDGYSNVLIENNLIYTETDWRRTNRWSEFIDMGENVVFRNNTFIGAVALYIASKHNGSNLHLYNNLFVGGLQINYDYNANARNSAPSHQLWSNVKEGGNIYSSLTSRGCHMGCPAPMGRFSSKSTSVAMHMIGKFGTRYFKDARNYDYHLATRSPAIGFADPTQAPTTE
jgi:hypothetical protein